jgi:hypothetical protein
LLCATCVVTKNQPWASLMFGLRRSARDMAA